MINEIKYIMDGNNYNQRKTVDSPLGLCRTIMGSGHAGNEPKTIEVKKQTTDDIVCLGNYYGAEFGTGYAGNVWDYRFLCPSIMTMQGGGRQPHILEIRHERD